MLCPEHKRMNYLFNFFSDLWKWFSKCGKVSLTSENFDLVPCSSISLLMLLARSVIMTGLPLDFLGSCTVRVKQRIDHISAGQAQAQLE
jgi:hypothetical protein